ncbi:ribosomal protection-like ABC-F family protein [Shouchella lonarensis]|uniref:ATPase components of ABC transporters with duplicated ATPase domains n=1 Tax=Shouchella lonarensis TaxID=1464122 RepID=A0A1G6P447_9BACI|nr:ABC-F type ribosomal protection protein [Shouchella lonarensis]SDC74829.1 ATPase components of ABC transporters with duplicated ATPase domains [Shouchella lonarensis]
MFIFQATCLKKEWCGHTLFENIHIELKNGEHVAVYGQNGVGKTTLLRGLCGDTPFDHGSVTHMVPVSQWAFLHQEVHATATLQDYVATGDHERALIKQQLETLTQKLEDPDSFKRYEVLYDRFLQMNGYNLDTDVEKCLHTVGLPPDTWHTPVSHLSGGQKTRAQIARILLQQPPCVVMDEPTNHLDEETITWLATWIKQYDGAVLYVSHDRYFLDETAEAIYELTETSCTRYEGGYTAYKQQKDLERKTQAAEAKKQEQERQALLAAIRNYQQWFQSAHKQAGQNDFARAKAKKNVSRLHAKESALKRLDESRIRKPQQSERLHMHLQATSFAGRTLLQATDVSFSYGHKNLFTDVTFSVNRSDKIAVTGPNGAGKTTLLKCMIGTLTPVTGKVSMSPQTKIGYFSQELDDLSAKQTILDSFLTLPGTVEADIRTLLGCFLFSRDDVHKQVRALSMGEKCRVAFLKLYLRGANLLVLDEPTNFLDIDTREIIEDLLQGYDGALVVVSHDRYFLEKIATRVLHVEKGRVDMYDSNYNAYREKRAQPRLNTAAQLRANEREHLQFQLTTLISATTEALSAEQETEIEELKARLRTLEREDKR